MKREGGSSIAFYLCVYVWGFEVSTGLIETCEEKRGIYVDWL